MLRARTPLTEWERGPWQATPQVPVDLRVWPRAEAPVLARRTATTLQPLFPQVRRGNQGEVPQFHLPFKILSISLITRAAWTVATRRVACWITMRVCLCLRPLARSLLRRDSKRRSWLKTCRITKRTIRDSQDLKRLVLGFLMVI